MFVSTRLVDACEKGECTLTVWYLSNGSARGLRSVIVCGLRWLWSKRSALGCFAVAWLRDGDWNWLVVFIAAGGALLDSDGVTLWNVAWTRSPGWLVIVAFLGHGVCSWDSACWAQ